MQDTELDPALLALTDGLWHPGGPMHPSQVCQVGLKTDAPDATATPSFALRGDGSAHHDRASSGDDGGYVMIGSTDSRTPASACQPADAKYSAASLFLAAKLADLPALQRLVRTGAALTSKDSSGRTLVHTSVLSFDPRRQRQCTQALVFLLSNNAEPNCQDNEGGTALMYACRNGHGPAVRALLDGGASPACVDATGMTACMFAAAYSNAPVLGALLQAGTNYVNARDCNGRTALHWAALTGSSECLRLLALAELADACILDSHGETVLHYVARSSKGVSRQLLDALAGCVPRETLVRLSKSQSADGFSPDELAEDCGNQSFSRCFAEALATADRNRARHKRPPPKPRKPAAGRQAEAKRRARAPAPRHADGYGNTSSSTDSGIDDHRTNPAANLKHAQVPRACAKAKPPPQRPSSSSSSSRVPASVVRRDYMRVRRAESREQRLASNTAAIT